MLTFPNGHWLRKSRSGLNWSEFQTQNAPRNPFAETAPVFKDSIISSS